MNLDPSLAYTAIIELRPNLPAGRARELTAHLAAAMTEANPPNRWTFASSWLGGYDAGYGQGARTAPQMVLGETTPGWRAGYASGYREGEADRGAAS